MSMLEGLPVAGYRPQSAEAVATVNASKQLEERVLRLLDDLAGKVDGRWLAIGRTHIEQGFMAVNRAVFQPSRIALPSDNPSPTSIPVHIVAAPIPAFTAAPDPKSPRGASLAAAEEAKAP